MSNFPGNDQVALNGLKTGGFKTSYRHSPSRPLHPIQFVALRRPRGCLLAKEFESNVGFFGEMKR